MLNPITATKTITVPANARVILPGAEPVAAPSPAPANSNAAAPATMLTLTLELVLAADPGARWALEGWAWHIAPARHQNHAAASFAKHRAEFTGAAALAARLLTIARCVDFGMSLADAGALVDQKCAARALKAVA